MTRLVFLLGLATLAALPQARPQASVPTGAIHGKLFDSSGDPIAKNAVLAENAETHAVFKAVTSVSGEYLLQGLPAGTYYVASSAPGLAQFVMKGVVVKAALALKLDIHLGDTSQLNTLGEDRLRILADNQRHHPPAGPAPRTYGGKPDLSGVWWIPETVDPGKPEFLPQAIAIQKQRLANNSADSPQARCLPSAPLRFGPLWEFVQSKDVLVYISDDESPGFHQIYLDGRPHPADPNPAWYGHSIGHWEGDTLVVDRVAFDPRVWLDVEAHPHSGQLHIIERYHRPDLGHMQIEITVDDPGVLAKPWTQRRVADLAQEEIFEFICQENNRDIGHMVGK
ncbi:MAG TPA: carboxypeptidase-like regulatory domain-containing protein [Bryobacteraceae bacterium]|nr:carboxypeptidase-like regulatory domain-containing protein [Bryobacteraceae bacterium]